MKPPKFFKMIEEGLAEVNRAARRDGVDLEDVTAKAVRGLARWVAAVNISDDFMKDGKP